jgi:hypothetical protein
VERVRLNPLLEQACGCPGLSVFGILVDATGTAQALLGVFYADLALLCAFVLHMPFYYTIAASLSVEGRLQSIAANGYLTRHGDKCRLTSKGRVTARRIQ